MYLLKSFQEEIDRKRRVQWNSVCKEIVDYGELKRRWGLGNICCVIKKCKLCSVYNVIWGYVPRGMHMMLATDFRIALKRVASVRGPSKSFFKL